MMMRRIKLHMLTQLIVTVCATLACTAQQLTVRVFDDGYKPVKHVPVTVRYNYRENRAVRKGELVTVKTDASGVATFANVHLDRGGFRVLGGGTCDVAETFPVFLLPADPDAQQTTIYGNHPVFTTLPSNVEIVVRHNSFGQCLRWILSGGP